MMKGVESRETEEGNRTGGGEEMGKRKEIGERRGEEGKGVSKKRGGRKE